MNESKEGVNSILDFGASRPSPQKSARTPCQSYSEAIGARS